MKQTKRLFRLSCAVLMIFLVSCAPATQNSSSPPSPSFPVSTPTHRFIPTTQTATHDPNDVSPELLFTPTSDPNAFTISAEVEPGLSQENITRILFSKWLDHFLGENISLVKRLDEYTINSIVIPVDQKCAGEFGGLFVAEVDITMKTTLPLASTTSNQHSDWTAGGGNLIDSYRQTKLFNGVIYRLENNYTLEVIMQVPIC